MKSKATLTNARSAFHASLLGSILTTDPNGVVSIADKHGKASRAISTGLVQKLGQETIQLKQSGQTSGKKFEDICRTFVESTFATLTHLRPGEWTIKCVTGRGGLALADYEQYEHLALLASAVRNNPELKAALGNDYAITPDIVVFRQPLPDSQINAFQHVVDESIARRTLLRIINNPLPIIHASISCKWTLRTDRAQNARSEALNLIRNRKGRLPHVVVVTAEPTPARIASLALGTGDIDCVYHFALPELQEVVNDLGYHDAKELLDMMVHGKRLKDIADLPLDLAI